MIKIYFFVINRLVFRATPMSKEAKRKQETKNKRLLVTLPQMIVDRLDQSSESTNLTKSQLIILCVKKSLHSIVDEYENPEQ